jgi:uncharacterized membrane protein YphA (DoxX/SURF4 family)
MNMAADMPGKFRNITIWILRLVLGLIFLFVAASKLTVTGNTVQYFAAIGWGQWFRYLTGSLDLLGVILLFVPRWTRYGAIILACSIGSAAMISLTVLRGNAIWGGPVMIVVPLVFTMLTVFLAWLTPPYRTPSP